MPSATTGRSGLRTLTVHRVEVYCKMGPRGYEVTLNYILIKREPDWHGRYKDPINQQLTNQHRRVGQYDPC